MRIAYMLTSLGIGGAERQVIALAERMTARGHTVVLLVLRPRQPEQWRTTVDVVHLDMNKSLPGAGSGVAHAHRFLRAFQPDLVHSHTFPANMTARMLHLLGSAPVVVSTIHNIYEGGLRRTILYSLTDGFTLHTTAVSDAVAKQAIRAGAVTPRKCSVVTNGIDTAEFAPDSERRSATRAHLHAGDDFIWLTAGRVVPAKDYPNLLRAFAQAQTSLPQMQLWIAGEASTSERSRIESSRQSAWTHAACPPVGPSPRHARPARRCRCLCSRLCVGRHAARDWGSHGNGERGRRNRCWRRARTRRRHGNPRSRPEAPMTWQPPCSTLLALRPRCVSPSAALRDSASSSASALMPESTIGKHYTTR